MDSGWSADAGVVQYRVRLGIWTNWSNGGVFGSTLTLSRENGNLLIAFTAFFVSLVATRLWRICCLALHHIYSTLNPQDGVYHQRQAIIRNSASPSAAIFTLSQLYVAWRKPARHIFLRTLPAILFATVCLCAFALATGFSSQISSAITNDVLIDGANCALIMQEDAIASLSTMQDSITLNAEHAKIRIKAMAYSEQCYPHGDVRALEKSREPRSGIFDCASYVVGRLPTEVIDIEASCPFGDGICATNNSNLLLDTGFIDSHLHLGINAPPNERIRMRQILRCAPLRTDGYKSHSVGRYSNYTTYHYGGTEALILDDSDMSKASKEMLNQTLQVEDPDVRLTKRKDGVVLYHTNFLLAGKKHFLPIKGPKGVNISNFFPIQPLDQNDSDFTLIFLITNGVPFSNKTNDPWYRANVPMGGDFLRVGGVPPNQTQPIYYATEAASPMGCLEQFQFCTEGASGSCGPLDSFYNAAYFAKKALFNRSDDETVDAAGVKYTPENERRYSQFNRFLTTLTNAVDFPAELPILLGTKTLGSQTTFQITMQWALPDDQWKRDVINWWSIWLAQLQTGFVDAAIGFGPDDSNRLKDVLIPPEDDYQRAMCQNQKVRSTRYTSFSMFGLCFIFAAGTLIVIVSFSIEPILSCIASRKQKKYKSKNDDDQEERGGRGAHEEWVVNETLHLQQLSFQGLGRGTWSGCTDAIPVTKPGEMLRSLVLLHVPGTTKQQAEATEEKNRDRDLTPQTTTETLVSEINRLGRYISADSRTSALDGAQKGRPTHRRRGSI
ncbi:hypothetical protein QBC43DRAFT_362527 [Cladorrhinum sp. PSN259]|nr:hypothetical protein QBC43DRAFT_362527 [Cladorrhinum sp. PSN259]